MEGLLVHAFKIYGSDLNTNAIDLTNEDQFLEGEEVKSNDFVEFELCFGTNSNSPVNIELLTHIVKNHHFTNSLCPPVTETGWQDLFSRLYRVFKQDSPKNDTLAIFLSKNSGASFNFLNENLIFEAFHDKSTTVEFLNHLEKLGLKVSANEIKKILTDTNRACNENQHVIKLLKSFVKHETELKEIALLAVMFLFREPSCFSVPIADFLITEFDLDEDSVGRALISKDTSDEQYLLTYTAQENNGMTDKLWQLIMGRYGIDHEYTQACFSDLVVGGLITFPGLSSSSGGGGGNHLSMASSPSFYCSSLKFNTTLEMDTTDNNCIDSIEALTEAGVELNPEIVGRIARYVLTTKQLHPRHIDFLSRIEGGLLNDTPGAGRWSVSEWISCFKHFVVNDPTYKQKLKAENLLESDSETFDEKENSFINQGSSFVGNWYKSVFFTSELSQVKKFYSAVESLTLLLTDPNGNPLTAKIYRSNTMVGPFNAILKDMHSKQSNSNPNSAPPVSEKIFDYSTASISSSAASLTSTMNSISSWWSKK
ncbi:hypothetical protein HK099_008710 [Clydaea vesicula]|uniref:Uncharacterized protein n=1 Tax=Clydaea vesicula TaxID=447962 RepID=A0AAD5Y2C2_9FUNG|nr:hypothetical protein HK099_008710 [Clydaea vesicula]